MLTREQKAWLVTGFCSAIRNCDAECPLYDKCKKNYDCLLTYDDAQLDECMKLIAPELVEESKPAAARMIRALPAVDAEPVRHGCWVAAESPAHLAAIKCSECNTMFQLRWKAYLIFCPHCGAKMDLEE